MCVLFFSFFLSLPSLYTHISLTHQPATPEGLTTFLQKLFVVIPPEDKKEMEAEAEAQADGNKEKPDAEA